MTGGYDHENDDAAARVHPPGSVAASEELASELETALIHFSAVGSDALRDELLSDKQQQAPTSRSASVQELTRLLTQFSQQQPAALSTELLRSVIAAVKALCKTATACISSVASSANEEVAGFLALDDNLAPIFEFLAAFTDLMHDHKPSTQATTAAASNEQSQSQSAAAYAPKALLRWVPFVLHACAHIACEQLPATESIRVFPVSQRILRHCEGITDTHSQPELFAKYIEQLVALCSQASASKEEWVDSRSFHKHVLRFVALQVPSPHLGGDLLGRLLALVFPLVDELSDATQLVGAQILQHVVHNVTATELGWYSDVLLEVLRLAITSRKPETINVLLDCLVTSLDKLSPPSEFAHYDKFFPRLLNDTSLCSEVAIRTIFLRRLRPMIERMGAPRSIHVIRYLQPLLKVLIASFEGINIVLLLETLETLRVTILSAWPRVPAHTEEIFVGVMRAVAFCEVFDAGSGGALQSPDSKEKTQILQRCEHIFVLLHDLGAATSDDEEAALEAQGQLDTQVLRMLHEVSLSCTPLKPFCERMTTKLHPTT